MEGIKMKTKLPLNKKEGLQELAEVNDRLVRVMLKMDELQYTIGKRNNPTEYRRLKITLMSLRQRKSLLEKFLED